MPAFTCVSVVGNLWSFCLSVNILIPFTWVDSTANIPFLKALVAFSYLHTEHLYFYKYPLFLFFFTLAFDQALLSNSKIMFNRLFCFLSASPNVVLAKKKH